MAFTLPALSYATDALEPHIDKLTMEIHHGKHHQAYVTNLNKALEGKPEANSSIDDIIKTSLNSRCQCVTTAAAITTILCFGHCFRQAAEVSQPALSVRRDKQYVWFVC